MGGRLEPLSPAGTSLRLKDLKDYTVTTVNTEAVCFD